MHKGWSLRQSVARLRKIAGLAEIAAGSIAMGLGGYLAARTDLEHYISELKREWRETKDRGVSYKLLFVDRERSTVTTLVRMEPGARIPAHRHLGLEQCLVLEGDLRSGSVGMSAGDFNCSLPGSIHDELATDGGALLLLVSPESYERLESNAS